MQILHLAHHHQYHIIKLKIILIILICLLCTGCAQDKVNINKIDIKSVEITDVIEIEYINNTDICLNYEYYFKNGILSIYFVETDKKNTYENLIQIKNTFSDIKAIEIIDDTQSRAIYPQLFW